MTKAVAEELAVAHLSGDDKSSPLSGSGSRCANHASMRALAIDKVGGSCNRPDST